METKFILSIIGIGAVVFIILALRWFNLKKRRPKKPNKQLLLRRMNREPRSAVKIIRHYAQQTGVRLVVPPKEAKYEGQLRKQIVVWFDGYEPWEFFREEGSIWHVIDSETASQPRVIRKK